MTAAHKPRLIGEILVDKGLVSQDQVSIALTEQKKTNQHLGKILVRLGFATEAVIRDLLGGVLGQVSIELSKVVVDSDAVQYIDKETARRLHVLAISFDADKRELTVAMSDTFNVVALDKIRALLGGDISINPLLAGEAEIEKAIDQFYGFELSVDGILREIETGELDYQSLEVESEEYSQPVVRLVNALLSDAVKRNSSDVHFEPEQEFLRIRYRIDGVLRQIRSLHRNYWAALAVRLKVMAGMDIAEMRAPQDGRFSLSLYGRPIDFRVSTLPTTHGENIVLRLLDRQKGIVPLDELGLHDESLSTLQIMIARPEGIILVTGPTGSGKTTTLYSMLTHLNNEGVNIMTLEDPVEYPMGLIRQTSVNEAVKLNFANGIRTIMRQDPDIILVGEIRDDETAGMAFRAAMTGHQVFSTLHTNSAVGAISRLLDIGVHPDIMAGNIIGIVAQRLVRMLCPACQEAYAPSRVERQLMGLHVTEEVPPVYAARGCRQCEHHGYKGRVALMELLRIDPELDELIAQGITTRELAKAAKAKGFKTLADDGIRQVLEGVTTLDEVSRVVDLTERLV
ncbi:MAG: Flp pilus assembly complex ATPase component [Gammaproteobacteria bacterium]|nr:Flp pilus assembly complex ATPase component [Gammaproteobacteria bacterium]